MEPSQQSSIPSSIFDEIFRDNPDPWGYTTRWYEITKFRATIQALPKVQFKNAFEIACAIGVITEKLAPKCDRLLSVDCSELGLAEARKRCSHLPQVRFEQMQIPQQFPTEKFDLILFSEVGFFFTMPDLLETKQKIIDALLPGGYLLMVHFRSKAGDYFIQDGETVHNTFVENSASSLKHLGDPRKNFFILDPARYQKSYRMDLFQRL